MIYYHCYYIFERSFSCSIPAPAVWLVRAALWAHQSCRHQTRPQTRTRQIPLPFPKCITTTVHQIRNPRGSYANGLCCTAEQEDELTFKTQRFLKNTKSKWWNVQNNNGRHSRWLLVALTFVTKNGGWEICRDCRLLILAANEGASSWRSALSSFVGDQTFFTSLRLCGVWNELKVLF